MPNYERMSKVVNTVINLALIPITLPFLCLLLLSKWLFKWPKGDKYHWSQKAGWRDVTDVSK